MKNINTTFVVIVDEEGDYLTKLETKGSLAFSAEWTERIDQAANLPIEHYISQKEYIDGLAKAVRGVVVKVEASYEIYR